MKKSAISLLFILWTLLINAQAYKEYPLLKELKKEGFQIDHIREVKNMQEFIWALGNNTVIIVDSGNYVFTDSNILGSEEEIALLDRFDTLSEYYTDTYVHDLDNLVIIGAINTSPVFIQPDGYNHVMKFRNVNNLFLQNLRFGHEVEGYCQGGVLLIHNSENIIMDNLELFGSGTEGLSLIDVVHINISNTLVTKSSEQLSSFSNVHDAVLENCRFVDNNPVLRGFAVYRSNITFKNSLITEKYPFYADPQLYDNAYDVLFLTDYYDFGEWYIDRSVYPLAKDIPKSVIDIDNTTINGELINCTYRDVNNSDWIRRLYGESYVEEDTEGLEDEYYEDYYEDNNYDNEHYSDYYENQPLSVEFSELTVTFPGIYNLVFFDNSNLDTINIYPASGESSQGTILRVDSMKLRKIKKVEHQYYTGIAINDGENCAVFTEWKNYISGWKPVPEIMPGEYQLPVYTYDEANQFPSFTENELLEYLASHGFNEAFESVKECTGVPEKNWDIRIWKISYKITGINHNNMKVARVINFIYEGC